MYCTARIDGASNPSGQADQDVYLKALVAAGSVDHIEYGTYARSRWHTAPVMRQVSADRFQVTEPEGRIDTVTGTRPVTVPGVPGPWVITKITYGDSAA